MTPVRRPGTRQRWQAQRMEAALDRVTLGAGGTPGAGRLTHQRLRSRYGEDVATWALALGCATVLRSHLLARAGLVAALVALGSTAGWGPVTLGASMLALAALEWTWGWRRLEVAAWEPERFLPSALERAGGLLPASAAHDEGVRAWLVRAMTLSEAEQEVFEALSCETGRTVAELEDVARAVCRR